jgi:hypothetical protein
MFERVIRAGKQGSGRTYVDDTAESTNSIWTVDNFKVGLHVFLDTTCNHNHILRGTRELFDSEIHHLSQGGLSYVISSSSLWPEKTHIFILEKLCRAKEQPSSLLCAEVLSEVEKKHDSS